jgi:hypothetical protein
MTQHVRMYREVEASPFANALDQTVNGVGRERTAPLGAEDEVAVRELPLQLTQCPYFVAEKRVNAGFAILDPANIQGCRSAELDLGFTDCL